MSDELLMLKLLGYDADPTPFTRSFKISEDWSESIVWAWHCWVDIENILHATINIHPSAAESEIETLKKQLIDSGFTIEP